MRSERIAPPWERIKTLAFEKEALGFHVSGHPLDLHEDRLQRFRTHDIRAAADKPDKTVVKLTGMLGQVRTRVVRQGRSAGQKMALASLADKSAAVDVVFFTDAYARFAQLVHNDAIVAVVGRVDHARGEPNVVIDEVLTVDQLDEHLASRIELDLIDGPHREPLESVMRRLDETLRTAKGNGDRAVDVLLNLHSGTHRIAMRPRLRVVPGGDLLQNLRQVLGPECVRVVQRKAVSSAR